MPFLYYFYLGLYLLLPAVAATYMPCLFGLQWTFHVAKASSTIDVHVSFFSGCSSVLVTLNVPMLPSSVLWHKSPLPPWLPGNVKLAGRRTMLNHSGSAPRRLLLRHARIKWIISTLTTRWHCVSCVSLACGCVPLHATTRKRHARDTQEACKPNGSPLLGIIMKRPPGLPCILEGHTWSPW